MARNEIERDLTRAQDYLSDFIMAFIPFTQTGLDLSCLYQITLYVAQSAICTFENDSLEVLEPGPELTQRIQTDIAYFRWLARTRLIQIEEPYRRCRNHPEAASIRSDLHNNWTILFEDPTHKQLGANYLDGQLARRELNSAFAQMNSPVIALNNRK